MSRSVCVVITLVFVYVSSKIPCFLIISGLFILYLAEEKQPCVVWHDLCYWWGVVNKRKDEKKE